MTLIKLILLKHHEKIKKTRQTKIIYKNFKQASGGVNYL